jgi:hypothetical protein
MGACSILSKLFKDEQAYLRNKGLLVGFEGEPISHVFL